MARKTNCVKNGKPMFRITMVIGHDEKGRAKRKEFFGNCEKDALAKKDAFMKQLEEGLDLDLASQPLGKAMHTWLFEVKKVNHLLKPTSFTKYVGLYDNFIKDLPLAKKIVSDIKSIDIQRALNELEKSGCTNSQLKGTLKLLKMFFIYAVEQGYAKKNPCTRSIAIPGAKPEKNEVEVFTNEEVEKLKAALVDHRMRLLVLMALGTGLRRGELLALRYSDIEGDQVYVHASLAKPTMVEADGARSTEFIIWEPKTATSHRRVPIPKDLQQEIKAHRARQIEERLRLGIGGEPEFIFTTETDNFIDPSNFARAFRRLLQRAGVPHKKFHALRHTYATRLVQNGADINTVQRLMGHSTITMTSIYFHPDMDVMKKAVESLNEWFK